MAKQSVPAKPADDTLRYAHPFYTSTPPADRAVSPLTGGKRMTDWIPTTLGPVPPTKGNGIMHLNHIIGNAGVKEIESVGTIRFHAVGDTSKPGGSDAQEQVADDMALDFHPDAHGANPAFFLHLGDVIYGPNKEASFADEFYRPYHNYPGKIVAIPGNHDGETVAATDPVSLQAFTNHFVNGAGSGQPSPAGVPAAASNVGIFRQQVLQPGVYWMIDAPFLQVIGLYSNKAENPGYLQGRNPDGSTDDSQITWLQKTLTAIAGQRKKGSRKALIIATHHPPFSTAGHSGSTEMLAAIDAACNNAGVMPDAFLAGHTHTYQRYTRRINFNGTPMEIPFVDAGMGGHGLQAVKPAFGQAEGDHTYDKAASAYGYVLVTVTPVRLQIDCWEVASNASTPFDTVAVNLQMHRLV